MPFVLLDESDNVIRTEAALPDVWRNYSYFPGQPAAVQRAAGWWPLTENRPTPGANQHLGSTPTYVKNATTVTANYALEADDTATINRNFIRTQAEAALTANANYQAIASPTVAQNTAQIRLLTRECNGLIRILLDRLETTTGT